MPLYRGVSAEVRRISRTAAWVVSGVVVRGRWHPAERSIQPASERMRQSGLVAYVELPDLIAPSDAQAIQTALWLSSEGGWLSPAQAGQKLAMRGSRTVSIDLDD